MCEINQVQIYTKREASFELWSYAIEVAEHLIEHAQSDETRNKLRLTVEWFKDRRDQKAFFPGINPPHTPFRVTH